MLDGRRDKLAALGDLVAELLRHVVLNLGEASVRNSFPFLWAYGRAAGLGRGRVDGHLHGARREHLDRVLALLAEEDLDAVRLVDLRKRPKKKN